MVTMSSADRGMTDGPSFAMLIVDRCDWAIVAIFGILFNKKHYFGMDE